MKVKLNYNLLMYPGKPLSLNKHNNQNISVIIATIDQSAGAAEYTDCTFAEG